MAIFDELFRAARDIFGFVSDEREDEPNEEADATDCDVPATACEFDPTDREAEADESEWVASDEINEAFKPEPIVLAESPEDGMPVPVNERSDLATAAPFSIDTVICVEDERSFVELFEEELLELGWQVTPKGAKAVREQDRYVADCKTPDGQVPQLLQVRQRYDPKTGAARKRHVFTPEHVHEQFGVLIGSNDPKWTSGVTAWPVRPIRERCKHYRRMSMACSDIPDPTEYGHFMLFRNCTQRRSVGGAFMTLRDEAVYACDYRDPPHPASVEKYLDEPDRKRLASAADVELIRPFNMVDG